MAPSRGARAASTPASGRDALAFGLQLHKAGRLQEAEVMYRRVLTSEPRQSDALHLLGVLALQVGNASAALPLLQQAVDLQPRNAAYRLHCGHALRETGDLDAAIDHYRSAHKLDPRNTEARSAYAAGLQSLGLQAQNRGDLSEAIARYRQAIGVDPGAVEAHNNLGLIEQQRGRLDEAIACFKRALVHGGSATVRVNLALACIASGRLPEAVEAARAAVTDDPDAPHAWSTLGHALQLTGDPVQACTALERAVTLRPDHAQAWTNLGVTLLEVGTADAAIDAFRHAVALQPSRSDWWQNLGNGLLQVGRPSDAVAALEMAAAVGTSPDIRIDLARAQLACGRQDEAVDLLEAVVAVSPDIARAWLVLGSALAMSSMERAAECLQRAAALAPDSPDAWLALGAIRHRNGDREGALDACHRAVERAPRHAAAWSDLASAHYRLGDLFEAERAGRKAIALDPDLADAHNNLGVILQAHGKLADAHDSYERALQKRPRFPEALVNSGNLLQSQMRLDDSIDRYLAALAVEERDDALQNLAVAQQYRGDQTAAAGAYARLLARRDEPGTRLRAAAVMPVIASSRADMLAARERLEAELRRQLDTGVTYSDPAREFGLTNFYLAFHGLDNRPLQELAGQLFARGVRERCPAGSGSDRIRVGFVSRYLHQHTIGKFNAGLIRELDRERFEVVVFQGGKRDSLSESIAQSADRAVRLAGGALAEAELIAGSNLDVVVFPEIGMDPDTLFLAHHRLAPVQVTTWGHPDTTGVPNVDYFLSSRLLEPDGAAAHYSERLIHLQGLPTVYEEPDLVGIGPDRARFGFGADEHLYVCPQSLFKLHPDFDPVMAEILRRDPKGKLVLVHGASANWARLLQARFQGSMPDVADRVVFLDSMPGPVFLALLATADVLLDPAWFGGGNTSYEAAAVGVPVVTWPGPFMRARVTSALYRRMGVADTVVDCLADYAARAVQVATDRDLSHSIRERIRNTRDLIFRQTADVREIEAFLAVAVRAARAGDAITIWGAPE